MLYTIVVGEYPFTFENKSDKDRFLTLVKRMNLNYHTETYHPTTFNAAKSQLINIFKEEYLQTFPLKNVKKGGRI